MLSGGGARGAYQVGVIQALCEICEKKGLENPFRVITGVSAGSINGAYLASHCHELGYAGQNLTRLWQNLETDKVVNINPFSFGRTGMKLLKQFVGKGEGVQSEQLTGLIDTTPLYELLKNELKYYLIGQNLQSDVLDAFAVTATNYSNSHSTTFIQSQKQVQEWQRVRREATQVKEIGVDHIMASSAIPLLFPPYKIKDAYYGDGAIRNTSPISPAIHLGVDKVIAVGVRMKSVGKELSQIEGGKHPSVGHVLSVIVHGLLMDAIDLDVERLERMNEMSDALGGAKINGREYKKVDCLWISPSKYLGNIAEKWSKTVPKSMSFFLLGLGSDKEQADLMSYLLFEKEYINDLIELGYEDTYRMGSQVEHFLQNA